MYYKTTRSGQTRCCKTKFRLIKQEFGEWHKGNGLTRKGRQTLCPYFMLLSFNKVRLWINKGYMVYPRADMWVLWDQHMWWSYLDKALAFRPPHFHLIKSFLCSLKYPNVLLTEELMESIEFRAKRKCWYWRDFNYIFNTNFLHFTIWLLIKGVVNCQGGPNVF